MKIVAILQARMGSTRLPGKVMLPLAGKPMLQNIIERVQRSTLISKVVVTSPLCDEATFAPLYEPLRTYSPEGACTKNVFGINWWDDPNDLVGRYVHAAFITDADLIVRIPCDNPCIDPVYLDAAIEEYLKYPFIYYSNTTAEAGGSMVDGIGAEVISRSRLHWLDQRTVGHPEWREHPHRYFEDCGLLRLPRAVIRLDVNVQADYDYITDIYDHFGHNKFTSEQVVGYLDSKVTTHGLL